MALSSTNHNLSVGTERINELAHQFAESDELPWMLASAAVLQAHKVIDARASEVLSEVGLTTPRYELLGVLAAAPDGRMTARDLKILTFTLPPTMTYTLDWLEERDLVERHPSATDRRTVDVVLTDTGRELFSRASAALAEIHFGLVGTTEEDALAAAAALARLIPEY